MGIKVKNLNKNFGNSVVFKNLNLEIEKGEIISIIGPSGRGKSTFLRCVIGLEDFDSCDIICNRKKNGNGFSKLQSFSK